MEKFILTKRPHLQCTSRLLRRYSCLGNGNKDTNVIVKMAIGLLGRRSPIRTALRFVVYKHGRIDGLFNLRHIKPLAGRSLTSHNPPWAGAVWRLKRKNLKLT
ncbi:hypothetical protein EVAR_84973_1 [Eumeta japonica]|uniref:Uncharacterized protein n=1 Tax=Eumeta variegata TaxID=151549 RepID=A0A4C1VJV0_EUMVA|nr:hypothetical protein EVAR_84973_1 [Eumeta japonica]